MTTKSSTPDCSICPIRPTALLIMPPSHTLSFCRAHLLPLGMSAGHALFHRQHFSILPKVASSMYCMHNYMHSISLTGETVKVKPHLWPADSDDKKWLKCFVDMRILYC